MKFPRNLSLFISTVAAGVFVSTAPAKAYNFTYNGNIYNVSIRDNISFTANQTLLTSQIWWGSGAQAIAVRNAVTSSPGWATDTHNTGGISTFLAYSGPAVDPDAVGDPSLYVTSKATLGGGGLVPVGGKFSYLTATFISSVSAVPFEVPGGATIPAIGTLVALSLIRKAKRRSGAKILIDNI